MTNYRNRVTVQSKTVPEAVDSYANPQEQWVDAFEVYASFAPSGSREFPTSWKRYSETTARFILRSTDETRAMNADKHRIVMIFDRTASPMISQKWNIRPPYPVDGKPFELAFEATEIK